jgi:hypothetical protein
LWSSDGAEGVDAAPAISLTRVALRSAEARVSWCAEELTALLLLVFEPPACGTQLGDANEPPGSHLKGLATEH